MMLFPLLLAQLALCWAGKPIDYTPLLKYLDDDIIRDLVDPLEGRGQTLVDNVEKYNGILSDVKGMIQQNVYEALVKAIELQKIGGPQFLQAKTNTELLKNVYKWTDDDLTQLQNQFESTKVNWKGVEAEFESAQARINKIHEEEEKEKAEMAEQERKRVEQLKKKEQELSANVTVNSGTSKLDT